ncbi:MAG: hypothetical protein H0V01_08575 [Bacteroidetes bacterium]|nr:hypothetical protein [Bacteroidota bacterium]HET6245228.1 hypothetical protein [Bacteroidia bacterium]
MTLVLDDTVRFYKKNGHLLLEAIFSQGKTIKKTYYTKNSEIIVVEDYTKSYKGMFGSFYYEDPNLIGWFSNGNQGWVVYPYYRKIPHTIRWEINKPLTWIDFKGAINETSPFDTMTFWELNYFYEYPSMNEVKLITFVNFDAKKSWYKNQKATDELLIHQQGLFDIIEIYSRIFIKRVEEANGLKSDSYEDFINQVFQKTKIELYGFHKEYSKETDHGRKEDKQADWTKKIRELLIEYNNYSNREIIFSIQ